MAASKTKKAGNTVVVTQTGSPIGRRNGMLASIRGDQLSAQVLNALVERNDLSRRDGG